MLFVSLQSCCFMSFPKINTRNKQPPQLHLQHFAFTLLQLLVPNSRDNLPKLPLSTAPFLCWDFAIAALTIPLALSLP